MVGKVTYARLEQSLLSYLGEDELAHVRRAYEVAELAHRGQQRDEGTPYILHPLRVAISLVEELAIHSPHLLAAALLHDVIEDTAVTREDIAEEFGEPVATVVWLLTKFENVGLGAYLAAIEAAPETGAPIVKLCDRLDNLRFLADSPNLEKRRRYIRTTEDHYIPLAARTNRYLHDELDRWLQEARTGSSSPTR